LQVLGILELFWAVLRHVRSPYRPAKGPLDFLKQLVNIQLYSSRRYPENTAFSLDIFDKIHLFWSF